MATLPGEKDSKYDNNPIDKAIDFAKGVLGAYDPVTAQEMDRISTELFGKPLAEYTKEQRKAIQNRYTQEQREKKNVQKAGSRRLKANEKAANGKSLADKKAKREEGKRILQESIEGMQKGAKQMLKYRPWGGIFDVIYAGKGGIDMYKNAFKGMKGIGQILFNHPEWYSKTKSDLVNLNYGDRKGTSLRPLGGSYTASTGAPLPDAAVSAAHLDIDLVIPFSQGYDAFDQAIQLYYTQIRKANTSVSPYTVQDLKRYVLCVRNVTAMIAVARRALQTINAVNFYDGSTPQAYCAAQGIDYDSWKNNAADIRDTMYRYLLSFRELMPLNMDILYRTAWLFTGALCDSDDAKFTPIFRRLKGFVNINVAINGTKTAQYIDVSPADVDPSATTTGLTWQSYLAILQGLFNSFRNDSASAPIASEIKKAFGEKAFTFVAQPWTIDEQLAFVYNESDLTQIQNATIEKWSITPTIDSTSGAPHNEITATLSSNMNASSLYLNKIVNTYKNTMNTPETISATRLIPEVQSTDAKLHVLSTSGEICSRYGWISFATGSLNAYSLTDVSYQGVNKATSELGQSEIIASKWAQTDWSPIVYIWYGVTSTNVGNIRGLLDLNNYAVAEQSSLATFNAFAILNLYLSNAPVKDQSTTKLK